jgi:carbamoyl-phosphate synthase large subunit
MGIGNRKLISILFTCIGRRVSLLNSFRRAAKQLRVNALFFGTDTTKLSSALQLCDKRFLVKPITHSGYNRQLLTIVKTNKVKLLVPTVDLDLKILAQNRAKFAAMGCRVLVSPPEVVDICQDKRKTYRFLIKNGFDTPVTLSVRAALSKKKPNRPCFLKPWDGYASRGNAVVSNRKELLCFAKRIPNCIVQEFIKRLVETLGAGPGVITLQLFLTRDNKVKFIEINPRFGGGIPLSIKAGANFPKWILQELLTSKVNIRFDGFKDNLVMLRYDGEVWLKNP